MHSMAFVDISSLVVARTFVDWNHYIEHTKLSCRIIALIFGFLLCTYS